jgi:hypothetical protein
MTPHFLQVNLSELIQVVSRAVDSVSLHLGVVVGATFRDDWLWRRLILRPIVKADDGIAVVGEELGGSAKTAVIGLCLSYCHNEYP